MLELIKNYIKGRNFEKHFFEGYKLIGQAIFLELFSNCKKERDEFTASVLAAQTMNYLMGTSVEQVMNESETKLKEKIGQIINEIPQRARRLMTSDPEIRNLVVQSLQFKQITDRAHFGKERAANLPEAQQVEKILQEYSNDVPFNLNSTEYLRLARQLYTKTISNASKK